MYMYLSSYLCLYLYIHMFTYVHIYIYIHSIYILKYTYVCSMKISSVYTSPLKFRGCTAEHTPDPQPTVYVSEFLSFQDLGMPGVCETGGTLGFS